MGILERIGLIVKSNINALLSKAEDPEKILNQLLFDMQENYTEAKRMVTVSLADEKRLEAQMKSELAQVEDWDKKARLAVSRGADDLAREALARKNSHMQLAEGYRTEFAKQKSMVDQLTEALRALQMKIEEAKRKKDLLIARQKRAVAQKTISETMSGITDTGAFDAFDRMEDKVDQTEAMASATTEMEQIQAGSDMDAQFRALETTATVDDQLAALKAEMGVGGTLPPKKDDAALPPSGS
jgi:phage shock protein A